MTRDDADAGLAWDALHRFSDPAGERFEAVLAAADLDEETSRALRFWHREALEGVRQYAAATLPAIFRALASAEADAEAAAERAGQAWTSTAPARPETIVLPDAEQAPRTMAVRLSRIG